MSNRHEGEHSLEQILDRSHELRKQSERLKHEVSALTEKVERLQRQQPARPERTTRPGEHASDAG